MTAQSVEGLGSTRMSSNLLTTLGRANDYARAQNHTKVTLEHVLLALSEDPDALVLLHTTNVNIEALKADVSGHISRNDDRHAEGAPAELTISSEVGDIMKAASAAARGRRPEINGAIVLAAIVGDGRSTAAHTLKAQGLTFEHAIQFLRSAPIETPGGETAAKKSSASSTDDLLAEARSRVQTRAGYAPATSESVSEEAETEPAPQEQFPETPPPPPPLPGVSKESPSREPQSFEAKPALPDVGSLTKKEAQIDTAGREPSPTTLPPAPKNDESGEPVVAVPTETSPPVVAAPAASQAPLPPPAGAQQAPLQHPSQQQQPAPAGPILPQLDDVFGGAPASMPQGLPPGQHQAPAGAPPQVQSRQAPPRGMPPQPQHPGQIGHAPIQPQPGMPAPQMRRGEAPRPPGQEPVRQRRPGANQPHLIEAGQLVENIPRIMKVGIPMLVEARIAKGGVRVVTQSMQGGGQPHRHEVLITKAMSVRLRAPANGFTVETSSPETQWIENNLGALGDDYASWRWTITPKTTGKKQLQLIVSARTVGSDGLAAETVLPDQIISVKVRTNYGHVAKRWGGWMAAAVVGGLFARFGETFFDLGAQLFNRFGSG